MRRSPLILLWPNGWMDQDGTWHADRPQPRRLCVRWGPSPLPKNGEIPQFSAHVYCDQMAPWTKMPFGTEVGLGPGEIVLDGDPARPSQIFRPFLLWPNGWMHQNATWYRGWPRPKRHCVRWGPSSPSPKRGRSSPPQFLAHVYCGQTAGWIKMG